MKSGRRGRSASSVRWPWTGGGREEGTPVWRTPGGTLRHSPKASGPQGCGGAEVSASWKSCPGGSGSSQSAESHAPEVPVSHDPKGRSQQLLRGPKPLQPVSRLRARPGSLQPPLGRGQAGSGENSDPHQGELPEAPCLVAGRIKRA